MEAVKLSRRRISDLDCNRYRQMKRRMVDGVCHLEEGGGSWHMANILPEKTSPATGATIAEYFNGINTHLPAKQPHLDFNHHHHHSTLNDGEALTSHTQIHSQHSHHQNHPTGQPPPPPPPPLLEPSPQLSSIVQPVLPPNLRESDRMKAVERWINSIPLDAPVVVQTSLTEARSIKDLPFFPSEIDITDPTAASASTTTTATTALTTTVGRKNANNSNCRGGVNYDFYPQKSQAGGYGSCPGVNSRGNTTTESSGNPHLANTPRPPPGGGGDCGGNFHSQPRFHGASPLPPPPPAHYQRIDDSSLMRSPPSRFFDDYETQFLVKAFSDYFSLGTCPSLNEVRRRIAQSQMQVRRNANSIRAKIKRLQASGRWTDFTVV